MFPVKEFLADLANNIGHFDKLKKAHKKKFDGYALSLKCLRVCAGVSLRSHARAMGHSAPYVKDVEDGNRNLTLGFAERYISSFPKASGPAFVVSTIKPE